LNINLLLIFLSIVLKETIKQIFPDDPNFVEKIQIYKENLMNKSSQNSIIKNNNRVENRNNFTNLNAIDQKINDIKTSFYSEKTKKDFVEIETKSLKNKSEILISPIKDPLHYSNQDNRLVKIKEQKNKAFLNNRVCENSFEIDDRQTVTDENKLYKDNSNKKERKAKKEKLLKEIKEQNTPEKIKKNLAYNLRDPNFNYKLNFYKFEKLKNMNLFNGNNSSYSNQLHIINPKIKIKISDESADNILNKYNDKSKRKMDNLSLGSTNENFGKNINININNKITNFYKMTNMSNDNDNKFSKNKYNYNEHEIQQKISLFKTKFNQKMIGILNDEKSRLNKKANHL